MCQKTILIPVKKRFKPEIWSFWMSDSLQGRGKALEDLFYANQDLSLIHI